MADSCCCYYFDVRDVAFAPSPEGASPRGKIWPRRKRRQKHARQHLSLFFISSGRASEIKKTKKERGELSMDQSAAQPSVTCVAFLVSSPSSSRSYARRLNTSVYKPECALRTEKEAGDEPARCTWRKKASDAGASATTTTTTTTAGTLFHACTSRHRSSSLPIPAGEVLSRREWLNAIAALRPEVFFRSLSRRALWRSFTVGETTRRQNTHTHT